MALEDADQILALLRDPNVGLASTFALAVAVPAFACDCDKKAAASEKSDKKATPAPAQTAPQQAPAQEKKADAAKSSTLLVAAADCKCGAKSEKDCKCDKGCKCHGNHAGDKQDKPKASAASGNLQMIAAACACGAKEAKDCKCGEKCKCTEKKDAPKAKAA